VRLRPLHRNHIWSFDFVQAQTHDGRSLRILTLIDEHIRALKVARRINTPALLHDSDPPVRVSKTRQTPIQQG
jgi:hypothetical protein